MIARALLPLLPLLTPALAAAAEAGAAGADAPEPAAWQLYFSRLPQPAILAALGAAVVLVAVWLAGRAQAGQAGGRLGRALSILRVAAAALVVLALVGPALRQRRAETERAAVFVMVDESQSMLLADRYAKPDERRGVEALLGAGAPERPSRMSLANAAKARLTAALGSRFNVETYAFSQELLPKPVSRRPEDVRRAESSALAPAGTETRLGSCLAELLDQTRGRNLAAVVVLSDGCSNSGEPVAAAAAAAAARRVPVYAVGLGDPAEPRDIAVSDLRAGEVCLKGDPVSFSARVSGAAYAGRSVEAALEEDGRAVQHWTVEIAATPQDVTVIHRPEKPGVHVYTLALAVQPDEALADNNRASATLRVEDAKIRVLLLAGEPGWEYRSLVAALARDKTIESSCYLQSADPTFPQEGSKRIDRLPRGEAELYAYDVVVLCGAEPNNVDFSAEFVKGLKSFVEERGGGLVFIAARKPSPYAYKGQRAEEILKMLPAELDLSRDAADFGKKAFDRPWRAQVPAEAADELVLRLSDDPAESAKVWKELPELYWYYPTVRLKPAAVRLLARPKREGEDPTLAALHYFGAGQVALMATDGTWRWRHLVGDKYYYRFWAQLIQRLAVHSALGRSRPVWITTDKAFYRPGEKVRVSAQVKRPEGPNLVPLRADRISLAVAREGAPGDAAAAPPETAVLEAVTERPGYFAGGFTAGATGAYAVWMPDAPKLPAPSDKSDASDKSDKSDKPGLTRFEVRLPEREMAELRMNRAELENLSRATGGTYLGADQLGRLDELAAKLPERSRTRLVVTERDVWDVWPALAALLVLLGVEWTVRKHKGML